MRLAAGSVRFRWQAVCVAAGAAAVLLLTDNLITPAVSNLNLRMQDWELRMTTKDGLPDNFLLIGLDDASLAVDTLEPEEIAESKALQHMSKGFPFSREVYALAGQKMLDAGAKLVIFDFVYPGPNPGDEAFAAFMKRNPGRFVVGGQFDGDTYRKPTSLLNAAAGEGVGFTNMVVDHGVIRYVRPFGTISVFEKLLPIAGEKLEPALTTAAAGILGKQLPEDFGKHRFRYSLPGKVQTFSLQELFIPSYWRSKNRNWDIFQNRIVLVGPTAEGMKDYHQTPFGRMSGPEIQLHILAAMLRDGWLSSTGEWFTRFSILVAAAGIFALATLRKSPIWFLLWLIVGAIAWLLICITALNVGSLFLPVAFPLVTWLVCGFLVLACDATLEGRERARLRRTLERYVSKDLVKELVDNPASYFHTLGGQRKEIVTLFSDLKGFTEESETMDAGEMVTLLNDYFGEMVAVVFQKRGTLDKFMGDALMATWGALGINDPRQDARHALQAAFAMQERLAAINARRGGKSPWQAGIGITQGSVVFGSIGSEEKKELTAIGDSVNLASRLESLTRIYGCDILVDEGMAENLRGECQLLLVDLVRVKGRQKPEMLFFPYPGTEAGPWAEAFVKARAEYREGKFPEAQAAFASLASEGLAPNVAALYVGRCAAFLKDPPAADWNGVWEFVTK